jgi:coenzyme F420-reducing hydrogenase delta subunit/ferredoxin
MSAARSALEALEAPLDRVFGAPHNPARHLGAIAFLLFWIVAASGAYLYAFYDTSITGAWSSVDRLTRGQWYLGGVARSLHRYAADAFVVATLAHLAREWLAGHFRGFRWFSWLSGVPLLVLMYASGIVGFWLAWDRLGQFSAIATAEWVDSLGFGPMMRNFLAPASVDDRLFSLFVFLHIGVPLFLLAGMWLHIQRISRAETLPPPALRWGIVLALAAAAVARPVTSLPAADLAIAPEVVALDWFFLFMHPLMYATSPQALTLGAAAALAGLLALPLLPGGARLAAAVVDPANCNGCGRCVADCPFAAVELAPRAEKPRGAIAVVLPDLCAGCGICAGACPSSTPFRKLDPLVSGIDLPQRTVGMLREELERALERLQGGARVVLFGCECAAAATRLADPSTAAIALPCTGMLPPSFVEYALRSGADGVLVTGCREGDCEYRLGNRWTDERFAGGREPHLRASVPRARLRVLWAGDPAALARELELFRAGLAALGRPAQLPPARKERAHA